MGSDASEKTQDAAFELKQLVYIPNLIDYMRFVMLYWAVQAAYVLPRPPGPRETFLI